MEANRKPSIPQVFQGQNILVTGGTGFVGKVLLEKLLRCCPGIGRIYLIVRPKRGDSLKQRMKDLLCHSFFDSCRAKQGDIRWCCGASEVAAMDDGRTGPVVVGISGDVSEKGLGLCEEDRSELLSNVSIIFHSAATVRFNDPLRVSVFMNTRGTREMLELASRMPLLKAFVHVSTLYAHVSVHAGRIEEAFYSVPMEPDEVIAAAEELNDQEFERISKMLASVYENTYLCTKALAERLIENEYNHLPIAIYRPGIVGAIDSNPVPGWSDGFQGLAMVVTVHYTGLLGPFRAKGNVKPEVIPVDHVVNAMLTVAWATIVDRSNVMNGMNRVISIYNHVSSNYVDSTWDDVRILGNQATKARNDMNGLPDLQFTTHVWAYEMGAYGRLLIFRFMDAVNQLQGRKSNLTVVQQKAKSGVDSVSYFMENQFSFSDNRLAGIREKYYKDVVKDETGDDRSDFDFNISEVDWSNYYQHYFEYIIQFLQSCGRNKLEYSLRCAQVIRILQRSTQLAGALLCCATVYLLSTSIRRQYLSDTETQNS